MDWRCLKQEKVYDYHSKKYRRHIVYETNFPVSYIELPQEVFMHDQLVPYFRAHGMITLTLYQAKLAMAKNESEREKIKNSFSFIIHGIEKEYIENDKLIIHFSLYEK